MNRKDFIDSLKPAWDKFREVDCNDDICNTLNCPIYSENAGCGYHKLKELISGLIESCECNKCRGE